MSSRRGRYEARQLVLYVGAFALGWVLYDVYIQLNRPQQQQFSPLRKFQILSLPKLEKLIFNDYNLLQKVSQQNQPVKPESI